MINNVLNLVANKLFLTPAVKCIKFPRLNIVQVPLTAGIKRASKFPRLSSVKVPLTPREFREQNKSPRLSNVRVHLTAGIKNITAGVICFCFIVLFPLRSFAQTIIFESPLVWRADGTGDYLFQDKVKLSNCRIAEDGAVEFVSGPSTCELVTANATNNLIISASVTWEFVGKVAMQLSVTGNASDYVTVTNGVPVEFSKNSGKLLRWKATLLEPGSRLTQVKISYKDTSGVAGSFGAAELSGFNFKKMIRINGTSAADLYNFQTAVTIGQSDKMKGCDATLKGVLQADFDDVRFTAADGETLLPYYTESISGASGLRVAKFWLKIPQMPKEGLPIYVYYGKLAAKSLSNAADVFDFYYDFQNKVFDQAKWEAADLDEGTIEYKLNSADQIQTLDRKLYSDKEKIIDFFKSSNEFSWVRQRKTIPNLGGWESVDTEEIPNLAVFDGVMVAANGDLVLEKDKETGTYTSSFIYPAFKTRIMIPQWKADSSGISKINVDINATGDDTGYANSCTSGNYYYASKKDFTPGEVLRWKAAFSRQDTSAKGPALKEFTLDFRAGDILITAPAKGEQITKGSTYQILWGASDYEPTYSFKPEYSFDNGKSYAAIVPKVDNSGKYDWQVPLATTDLARIKITDGFDNSIYAVSDIFSVAQQGQLKIVTPEAAQPAVEPTKEESALQAEVNQEVAKENQPRQGMKPYEILIKLGDNTLSDPVEDARGSYKEGDVVMVIPAGHKWSATEKNSFLILQADLTEKEAREFMLPEEISAGKDRSGRPLTETVSPRKYKIDLIKQGLIQKKAQAQQALLAGKPLSLDVGAFEKKSE